MTTRNILMQPSMAQATFEDRKTNTRRLGGLEEINEAPERWVLTSVEQRAGKLFARFDRGDGFAVSIPFPYGAVGDRLRVKEAVWQWGRWVSNGTTKKTGKPARKFVPVQQHFRYVGECPEMPKDAPDLGRIVHADELWVYRQSMFMPLAACRSVLEITGVRAQRVQDISEEDAKSEGLTPIKYPHHTGWAYAESGGHFTFARTAFKSLWESINGPGSWDRNDWVFAVAFRRVEV